RASRCHRLNMKTYIINGSEVSRLSVAIHPRHAHCVTLYHNGFTCEADTLGSCGYVYIAVYPTQR
ncbi:type IV toxin-antitoxin system YeeU family antitoxin, partial [Enterobacter roggenkampii]|uniref:type IV toxin-antitoxin system YeeU family antitoxin n=1 Tax=Enterobacter roggenkampii TaxID=1812935 RepID=UPI0021ADBB99